MESECLINEKHCEECGSADPEDVETSDDPDYQGYSRCCNENVVIRQCCRNFHEEIA